MPTSFFLDTNALIRLSGLDSGDLAILSAAVAEDRIRLCTSHVQIDEQRCQEYRDHHQKIEDALRKLRVMGAKVEVELAN